MKNVKLDSKESVAVERQNSLSAPVERPRTTVQEKDEDGVTVARRTLIIETEYVGPMNPIEPEYYI
jgi:hypothetical protein